MTLPPPSAVADPRGRPWWESRPFVALVILLTMVPLLYPQVPPLVDLPGHMGRYRVQLDLDSSPWLPLYYGFQWRAIGNLGVDLLIIPLSKLFGLELAVKLIVISIPPLAAAGFLWVAREVHHRLPPTMLFALPFVYNHPFLFGFVNFALSMALAFLAFGLWLRLGRLDRTALRAILFVPISIILFFAHAFGWGTLGLLAFSAEAVRQHDRGVGWLRSGFRAALHAAVMALPLLMMLRWRTETPAGGTGNWFHWQLKWEWVHSVLRDRWKEFDWASLALVALVVAYAVISRRLTLSRNLLFSGLVLAACYLLLPWTLMGSAYADMRLAPYMVVIFVLAIRFRADTHMPTARVLAVLGLAFFLVRLAGNTASLAIAADDQERKLQALEEVPMGSRVATLVGRGCTRSWALPRNGHLGGMVIVRREGFSNDQWEISGSNPLIVDYPPAGFFQSDPSQMVTADYCGPRYWSVDDALRRLPREAFDFVWMIDPPPFDESATAGMQPVWSGPRSALFRISPGAEGPQPATLRTEAASGR